MRTFFFLAICFFTCSPAFSQSPHPARPYTKECSPDVTITLHEIQNIRIPYYLQKDSSLNGYCKKEIKKQISKFEQEDRKKWAKLANQLCAFKTNPKSPQARAWVKQKKDIYEKREKVLQNMSCNCRGEDIDNQQTEKLKQYNLGPREKQTGQSDFVLHCTDGQCPEGYRCDHGVCIENNPLFASGIKDWQGREAKGQEKQPGIAFFIENMDELAARLSGADINIFTQTRKKPGQKKQAAKKQEVQKPQEGEEFDNWKDAYTGSLSSLKSKVTIYQSLLTEYSRADANGFNGKARGQSTIMADLQKVHTQMEKSFRSLNIAYTELMDTKNNASNSCSSAFAAYHKWYCYYFVKILNVRPGA